VLSLLLLGFPLAGASGVYSSCSVQASFCGGSVMKNLPANAGDVGLIPDLGRSHTPRSN